MSYQHLHLVHPSHLLRCTVISRISGIFLKASQQCDFVCVLQPLLDEHATVHLPEKRFRRRKCTVQLLLCELSTLWHPSISYGRNVPLNTMTGTIYFNILRQNIWKKQKSFTARCDCHSIILFQMHLMFFSKKCDFQSTRDKAVIEHRRASHEPKAAYKCPVSKLPSVLRL